MNCRESWRLAANTAPPRRSLKFLCWDSASKTDNPNYLSHFLDCSCKEVSRLSVKSGDSTQSSRQFKNERHAPRLAYIHKFMETKSLYTVLGIRPDASPDQIETAYAELLHQLKDGSETNPGGDDRVRLIAAKEAYAVLSNSVSRQQYNQKLFAPQTFSNQPEIVYESSNSWSIPKLLVIGFLAIAAIWIYNDSVAQRERLRIEHAKEVEDKLIKLQQDERNEQEADRQAQLERQQEFQKAAQDNAFRESALREARQIDLTLQQQAQQEARERQMQQLREDAQLRQQKSDAERQIAKEKMEVQTLEIENHRYNYRN
jgi:curved DNA-binding protein CbpA